MKVITAPDAYTRREGDICCYLSGGITNCPNWQQEVIQTLQSMEMGGVNVEHLVIFNPRRNHFPIDKGISVIEEQIAWEYGWLEQADIFAAYLSGGGATQPLTMYEIGRNVLSQMKRGNNWADRIIVSVDHEYKYWQDITIQIRLATGSDGFVMNSANPAIHAARILSKYTVLAGGKK